MNLLALILHHLSLHFYSSHILFSHHVSDTVVVGVDTSLYLEIERTPHHLVLMVLQTDFVAARFLGEKVLLQRVFKVIFGQFLASCVRNCHYDILARTCHSDKACTNSSELVKFDLPSIPYCIYSE